MDMTLFLEASGDRISILCLFIIILCNIHLYFDGHKSVIHLFPRGVLDIYMFIHPFARTTPGSIAIHKDAFILRLCFLQPVN